MDISKTRNSVLTERKKKYFFDLNYGTGKFYYLVPFGLLKYGKNTELF